MDGTGGPDKYFTYSIKKSTQLPHPEIADQEVEQPLKLTSMDITGPIVLVSMAGFSYLHKFACQVTDFKTVCMLKSQRAQSQILRAMIEELASPNEPNIQRLKTDHIGEYVGYGFERYLRDLGTRHKFSSSYTPSQMRRRQRTYNQGSDTLSLNEAKPPQFLWLELAATARCVLTRIPNETIDRDTSYHRRIGFS